MNANLEYLRKFVGTGRLTAHEELFIDHVTTSVYWATFSARIRELLTSLRP